MRFTKATTVMAVWLGLVVTPSVPASADPIVWNGPSVTFTKPAFADPTLAVNQDRLTNHVWLTRRNTLPLLNIFVEEFSDGFTSPRDTEWAFGPTQPGSPGPITASNFANLVFDPFTLALDGAVGRNIVRFGPGVLHLISEDIYLDIRFTLWARRENGGGFSYIRSTPGPAPVPEPATLLLVTSGLGGVLYRCRRSRRNPTSHVC